MKQAIAITHVMEPFLPDTHSIVMVGGATEDTRVYAFRLPDDDAGFPGTGLFDAKLQAVETNIAQRTGECLTVRIPGGEFSVWALQLSDRFDGGEAWVANRPRLDWCFPSAAVPGRELRLQGRNLVKADSYPSGDPEHPTSFGGLLEGKTRIVAQKVGGDAYVDIPVSSSSAYEARVTIPSDMEPGEYEVFAHNGLGGTAGWSEPTAITVRSQEAWPDDAFRVDDYAAGDDVHIGNFEEVAALTADTVILKGGTADAAVAKALAAIEANGGGVLEFSAGIYDILRTIVLPPKTVMRGAGQDRTLLRCAASGGPQQPYVVITGDRDFVIEDLAIHAVYAPVMIAAPTLVVSSFDDGFTRPVGSDGFTWSEDRARNITIRRCNLAQRLLLHHDRRDDHDHIAKMQDYVIHGAHQGYNGSVESILIKGDDIVVEDNVVYGGGSCVKLDGSSHARISRNHLVAGFSGHCLYCIARLHWPQDGTGPPAPRLLPTKEGGQADEGGRAGARIDGHYCREIIAEDNVMEARSIMSRDLFYFLFGGENALIARNEIRDIERTYDAEMLGFHLWMARWKEPSIRMTGATTAEIIDTTGEVANEWLEGAYVDIVDGRGVGQMRRIVRRNGDTIELEKPWHVDPDETSNVVFTAPSPFHNMVVVDNEIHRGGSNIIFWGCSNDIVIDGNNCSEGSGIQVWSVRLAPDQKVWGGAAFSQVINNTMSTGWAVPAEDKLLDAWVCGVIGIPCSKHDEADTDGYDILGYVARNNVTKNHSGIVIKTTYRTGSNDTWRDWFLNQAGFVIENNFAKDSVLGVVVEEGANAVVCGNKAENVVFPLTYEKHDSYER